MRHLALAVSLLVLALPGARAQTQPATAHADSAYIKGHSPRKATIYSLVLPGLGQAYNHKYWKVPVVYAGFAATAYFIHFNHNLYVQFKDAYQWSKFDQYVVPAPNPSNSGYVPEAPNSYASKYTADQLLAGREYYRRNLEISIIATGLWYVLQVLDATVDAHFMTYDISDDLSMNVSPMAPAANPYGVPYTAVLSVQLNFGKKGQPSSSGAAKF